MIVNITNYIKEQFFIELNINNKKICILSDSEINTKLDFFKFNIAEPVGQIIALAEKYDLVFVVLDRLNYDNIFRMYKNYHKNSNVCVINLNSGYTGIGKKIILPDLDDIYINPYTEILEIMDKENFKFFITNFINNPKLTHIRIPSKEIESKIGENEINMEYDKIINFNQFGIQGNNGTMIAYGSMLQECINVIGLLNSEGINMDLFRIGNYKQNLSQELINSIEDNEKVFIVGDFDKNIFKDYIFSKFFQSGINFHSINITFITPQNIKQVADEFLSEQVEMEPVKIYERIKKYIN